MVEGPVEFKSSGGPRAKNTEKRGLYNVILIEEAVSVLLIVGIPDLTSKLGKNSKLNKFVFKSKKSVFSLLANVALSLKNNLVGIGVTRRTLMYAVLNSGLSILGYEPQVQQLIKGIVFLIFVALTIDRKALKVIK